MSRQASADDGQPAIDSGRWGCAPACRWRQAEVASRSAHKGLGWGPTLLSAVPSKGAPEASHKSPEVASGSG